MADLRVTGGVSPNALQPARPNEAVRAAQRAFFTAALNNVAPTKGAHPVQAQAAPRAATMQSAQPEVADQPARFARPGSLLDIKV